MSEVRLIDANAFKEELKQWFPKFTLEGVEPKTLFNQILHDINNAPTVELTELCKGCQYLKDCETCDKTERPKGEWKILSKDATGVHKIECPFCEYSKGSEFSAVLTVTFDKFPQFCENCGADMRSTEE